MRIQGIILVILVLLCGTQVYSQSIVGPTSVNEGMVATYTYSTSTTYSNPCWTVAKGVVTSMTRSGLAYTAVVRWNAQGTGSLTFSYNCVATQPTQETLTVMPLTTPPGGETGPVTIASISVTISGCVTPGPSGGTMDIGTNTCGPKTITFTSDGDEPIGIERFWQTTPTGTSVLKGGLTYVANTSGTYYMRDRLGSCWGSAIPVTVTVSEYPATPDVPLISGGVCGPKTLTEGTPPAGTDWYWQGTNGAGTDYTSATAVSPNYSVSTNGTSTVYLRARTSDGCWSTSSRTITVTTDNPPTPNSRTFDYCEWETLYLSSTGESYNFAWYDQNQQLVNTGTAYIPQNLPVGTYQYSIKIKSTQNCLSQTPGMVTLHVNACDDYLNTVETTQYTVAADGSPQAIGSGKVYGDAFGNSVQSQVKSYTTGQVLATQSLNGWYGKAVGSTLPAPINDTNFGYRHRFVTNSTGGRYTANDFDKPVTNGSPGEATAPNPVVSGGPGTLGWYYSSDNSQEPLTPVTNFPYGRSWAEPGPNSKLTKTSGPGDQFQMGNAPSETKQQAFKRSDLANYYALQPNFTLTSAGPEPNIIPGVTDGSTTLGFAKNGNVTLGTVVQNGETYVQVTAGQTNTPGAWPIGGSIPVTPGAKYKLRVKGYRTQSQPVALFIRNGSGSNLLWPGAQLPLGAANEAWVENIVTIPASWSLVTVGVLFSQPAIGDVFYINAITFTPVSDNNTLMGYQYISHTAEPNNKTTMFVDADGRTLATARITATNTSVTPNTYTYDQWQYMYYNDLGQLVATVAPNGVNTGSTAMPGYVTRYRYDHFGRTIEVTSPDEGTSQFVYSTDGMLRFSQNQVQREANPQRFSYTNYDSLGRVIEAGEYTARLDVTGTPFVFETLSSSAPAANSVLLIADNIGSTGMYSKVTDGTTARYTEVTLLEYDLPSATFPSDPQHQTQAHLDGRLSRVRNDNGATWYSYDEFGRVSWTKQSIIGYAFKTIDYTYDFVGNVTQVAYQKGNTDAYYHHYVFDADQRLSEVWTSLDGTTKTKQAAYQYYLHGPLKRVELTPVKQGIDYIYTASGALKGINHAEGSLDPGQDGLTGSTNASNKPDVFGMTLWYGDDDYIGAGGLGANSTLNLTNDFAGHYNEVPTAMLYHAPSDRDKIHLYGYQYDANRWLTNAQWGDVNVTRQGNDYSYTPTLSEAQRESVPSYDKNGNIQSLVRKGNTGQVTANYNYVYEPGKNQLDKVNHNGALFTDYTYNSIGQMIQMTEADKTYKLTYTASGKVGEIRDASGVLIQKYAYDGGGQLLKKTTYTSGTASSNTFYVHDPSGNVMATYAQNLPGSTVSLIEQPIYGASRIGVYRGSGKSLYEVTDHLGNVRAVIGTPTVETETATMESELNEEPPFKNIAAVRVPFVTANHTGTIVNVNSNEVVRLNNAAPAGPTRSLAVTPGDKIDLDVWAYYETGDYSGSISDAILLNAVASAFGGVAGGPGETGQIFEHVNAGFPGTFQGSTSSSLPAAFLTYVVYDQNYNRLFWGSQPVTTQGNGAKEHLVQPTITIDQPGYIYICLYNRSATPTPVYFDDLTVTITHSEVVAGSDYYPFGLTMDGTEITDEEYRYGYQGQFSEKDSTTGWNEFNLRMYDPRIGRWLSPDPYGQFVSPYIGMGNMPNMNTDPDGGSTGPVFAGVSAFKYAGAIEAIADEMAIYSAMRAGITIFKPITVTASAFGSFMEDAGWIAADMGRYAVDGRWGRDLGKVFTGASIKATSINHGWVGADPVWARDEYNETLVTFGKAAGIAETMMTMTPGGTPGPVLATPSGNIPVAGAIAIPLTRVLDGFGRIYSDAEEKLPSRDSTGKMHGTLPKRTDLWKYSREALEFFLSELKKSVVRRIQETIKHGPNATDAQNRSHGQRQAAEQQLIKDIENYLTDN